MSGRTVSKNLPISFEQIYRADTYLIIIKTIKSMREIEVKARLQNKAEVMQKLVALGCIFSDPKVQNDVIFQKKDRVGDSPVARIRTTSDSTPLFTVKKRATNELVAQEYEVTVNSSEELEKMLLLLEQEEVVRINKTRISAQYKNYEICIDDVEDIGSFIEVETMIPDAEEEKAENVQDESFVFLVSLGVSPEDRVTTGYNTLLLAKKSESSK